MTDRQPEPKALKKCVLVVDDDSSIRSLLAEGLTDAGYQVQTALSGQQALERMAHRPPDAVLLDLFLPDMDGWAFLRQRQLDPQLLVTPVVVVSAAGRQGLRDAAALRADAVLAKPFDLDVLSTVLERLLRDIARRHPVPPGQAAVGECPICGSTLRTELDAGLLGEARVRAIHAARRAHVLSHSAAELAHVPLRSRLLQLPGRERRILADWVYWEMRQDWGDQDRRGVYSVDEVLGTAALHRLYLDRCACGWPGCQHEVAASGEAAQHVRGAIERRAHLAGSGGGQAEYTA